MTTPAWDVLVVGAGPSGAATAHWLAEAGHRVLVVDKKQFPREKTCGDGLTPRAVRQLHDMGLAEPLEQLPALRRPALDRARRDPGAPRGPTIPTSLRMGTWFGAATSTRWWPSGR